MWIIIAYNIGIQIELEKDRLNKKPLQGLSPRMWCGRRTIFEGL